MFSNVQSDVVWAERRPRPRVRSQTSRANKQTPSIHRTHSHTHIHPSIHRTHTHAHAHRRRPRVRSQTSRASKQTRTPRPQQTCGCRCRTSWTRSWTSASAYASLCDCGRFHSLSDACCWRVIVCVLALAVRVCVCVRVCACVCRSERNRAHAPTHAQPQTLSPVHTQMRRPPRPLLHRHRTATGPNTLSTKPTLRAKPWGLCARRYDVPYHIRFQIDTDVRCAHWFTVSLVDGIARLERRADLLQVRPGLGVKGFG
jgi:hypothetical protein